MNPDEYDADEIAPNDAAAPEQSQFRPIPSYDPGIQTAEEFDMQDDDSYPVKEEQDRSNTNGAEQDEIDDLLADMQNMSVARTPARLADDGTVLIDNETNGKKERPSQHRQTVGEIYAEDLRNMPIWVRINPTTLRPDPDGEIIPWGRVHELFPYDNRKFSRVSVALQPTGLPYYENKKIAQGYQKDENGLLILKEDGTPRQSYILQGSAQIYQTPHGPRKRLYAFENPEPTGGHIVLEFKDSAEIWNVYRSDGDSYDNWTAAQWKVFAAQENPQGARNPQRVRLHFSSIEGFYQSEEQIISRGWDIQRRLNSYRDNGGVFGRRPQLWVQVGNSLRSSDTIFASEDFRKFQERILLGDRAEDKSNVYISHPDNNVLMPASSVWANHHSHFESVMSSLLIGERAGNVMKELAAAGKTPSWAKPSYSALAQSFMQDDYYVLTSSNVFKARSALTEIEKRQPRPSSDYLVVSINDNGLETLSLKVLSEAREGSVSQRSLEALRQDGVSVTLAPSKRRLNRQAGPAGYGQDGGHAGYGGSTASVGQGGGSYPIQQQGGPGGYNRRQAGGYGYAGNSPAAQGGRGLGSGGRYSTPGSRWNDGRYGTPQAAGYGESRQYSQMPAAYNAPYAQPAGYGGQQAGYRGASLPPQQPFAQPAMYGPQQQYGSREGSMALQQPFAQQNMYGPQEPYGSRQGSMAPQQPGYGSVPPTSQGYGGSQPSRGLNERPRDGRGNYGYSA